MRATSQSCSVTDLLIHMCRYPLLTVAMEGSIMLLRFLLNSGANIETKSDMGNTALLYAAQVMCDV